MCAVLELTFLVCNCKYHLPATTPAKQYKHEYTNAHNANTQGTLTLESAVCAGLSVKGIASPEQALADAHNAYSSHLRNLMTKDASDPDIHLASYAASPERVSAGLQRMLARGAGRSFVTSNLLGVKGG